MKNTRASSFQDIQNWEEIRGKRFRYSPSQQCFQAFPQSQISGAWSPNSRFCTCAVCGRGCPPWTVLGDLNALSTFSVLPANNQLETICDSRQTTCDYRLYGTLYVNCSGSTGVSSESSDTGTFSMEPADFLRNFDLQVHLGRPYIQVGLMLYKD